jgi:hypothetical protein
MNKYLIFFAVLLFSSISFSQGLKYNGAFEQGNLVIAKGNNIEWAWLNEVELKIDNAKVFTFGFDAKETGN